MVINMKFICSMFLALFPFLHDQKYVVTLNSCEQEAIVFEKDGTPFQVDLFNIKIINEDGWNKVCTTLKNAQEISIELDSSTAIQEPLSAYVFVDNALLQEDLIREDYAYSLIHNPEYTYEKKLIEIANDKRMMAQESVEEEAYPYPASGWKFLLCVILIWIIVIIYGLYKRGKIPFRKH